MQRKFGAKNTDDACNAKFCPVNSSVGMEPAVGGNPTPHRVMKKTPPTQYEAANVDSRPERLIPFDPDQVARNRALRQQKDLQRQQEQDAIRNRYQMNIVVQGAAEATKIRLLLTLKKFQEIGIAYKMVSDYFGMCFKRMSPNGYVSGDAAIIGSFLVFEKSDLVDSNACYASAIAGINKTTTTDYSSLADAVGGLSSIITDLKL